MKILALQQKIRTSHGNVLQHAKHACRKMKQNILTGNVHMVQNHRLCLHRWWDSGLFSRNYEFENISLLSPKMKMQTFAIFEFSRKYREETLWWQSERSNARRLRMAERSHERNNWTLNISFAADQNTFSNFDNITKHQIRSILIYFNICKSATMSTEIGETRQRAESTEDPQLNNRKWRVHSWPLSLSDCSLRCCHCRYV